MRANVSNIEPHKWSTHAAACLERIGQTCDGAFQTCDRTVAADFPNLHLCLCSRVQSVFVQVEIRNFIG